MEDVELLAGVVLCRCDDDNGGLSLQNTVGKSVYNEEYILQFLYNTP
jgi:hypothetical protein